MVGRKLVVTRRITRRFDGKLYLLQLGFRSKTEAEKTADQYRSDGFLVRVTKEEHINFRGERRTMYYLWKRWDK